MADELENKVTGQMGGMAAQGTNGFSHLLFDVAMAFALAVMSAFSFATQVAADGPLSGKVYLPAIFQTPCLSTPQEQELAMLMIQDANQQRVSPTCHPLLAQVARERARDMARRGYFSHTTPEGYGPNFLVRQAGYVLPSYYGTQNNANNIESIAAGSSTASATWQQWMGSSAHRTHLLGLVPFFAEQIEYGIGYANDPDSPFGYYWVVITAKPGP